ncbi:MAG: class I SAM-dependent methyltransferase [Planctomycetaceae bacterium]|nr:class I SAM-dependent methyltransferase [Planctomycetaceae bacterium]
MSRQELAAEFQNLNQLAAGYDNSNFDRLMRHWMLRSLEPFLVPGSALEMGCMYGEFTSLLAERYSDLTVVDAAAQFLEITRQRVGDKAVYHQALFEDFTSDRKYDNIFLMHVLEHLIDPVEVLRKASDLLSPQGRIHAIVPNGNAVSRQIAVKMGLLKELTDFAPADHRGGHRRIYVMDTFQRDARAAGLTIVRSGGVFFKALANFQFDALVGGNLISDEFMEACYQLGDEYPQLTASIYLVCKR